MCAVFFLNLLAYVIVTNVFFWAGSGMKDVSAWQMSRRWDGLNELSSGRNEGVKTPRKKKGTENNENRFYIVCAPTMRATEACGSKDNTENFLSLVSNHLEIHRGSKFHVMRSQRLKKWSCRRHHDIGVRVLADVDVTLQEE